MGRTNRQMFYLSKIYKLSQEMFLRGESLSARFCLSFPPPPFSLSCVLEKGTRWPNLSELQGHKEGVKFQCSLCIINFLN